KPHASTPPPQKPPPSHPQTTPPPKAGNRRFRIVHRFPPNSLTRSDVPISNQAVIIIGLGHEIKKMTRALDNSLAVRCARRNIYTRGALGNNFLIADDKFDLEASKIWPGSNRGVLGVAVMVMLVDVIGLRGPEVGDATNDGVEARLRH